MTSISSLCIIKDKVIWKFNLKWQLLAKNQDDWYEYLQTKQLEIIVNAELIVS